MVWRYPNRVARRHDPSPRLRADRQQPAHSADELGASMLVDSRGPRRIVVAPHGNNERLSIRLRPGRCDQGIRHGLNTAYFGVDTGAGATRRRMLVATNAREPAMRAEDILPDGVDHIEIAGVNARKGSVAAFLASARVFSDVAAAPADRATAQQHIVDLLPTLRALGLFDVLAIRDPVLQAFVDQHG